VIDEGAKVAADARDAIIVREAVRNVLAVVDSIIIDYCFLLLLLPALEFFDSIISLCLMEVGLLAKEDHGSCYFAFSSSARGELKRRASRRVFFSSLLPFLLLEEVDVGK
jgi:hypothetical protein